LTLAAALAVVATEGTELEPEEEDICYYRGFVKRETFDKGTWL
jgi:hypothetical protein